MSQTAVNIIHRSCRDLAHRLRVFFGNDPQKVDLCDATLAEHLHELTCERLGLDPNMASARSGTDVNRVHPWNRRGTVKAHKR